MDGDIYGPSMPTMLGIRGVPPSVRGNKILPHQVHGIHAITIGSLVEQDKPLIWRGPMAHGAFKQLLLDNTEWPALDYLIVDLPPGTGDVPLTLCQLLPLTGAVVVATPQQVALDDAIRAVRMFQQLGAPILGLVENMSYFIDERGAEHDIFGRGGTERAAQRLGLPYLGAVPMFTELRVTELLELYAALYDIYLNKSQIAQLLERFGLAQKAGARPEQLSGGQKQRLALALAVVNDPQIVLLDEPTTGLDPQARRGVWVLIRRMKAEGRTVLLTTHSMEEAQELCDRVGIIEAGKLVVLDTPRELIRRYAALRYGGAGDGRELSSGCRGRRSR